MADAYYKRYQAMTAAQKELHRRVAEYGEECAKLGHLQERTPITLRTEGDEVQVQQRKVAYLWEDFVCHIVGAEQVAHPLRIADDGSFSVPFVDVGG